MRKGTRLKPQSQWSISFGSLGRVLGLALFLALVSCGPKPRPIVVPPLSGNPEPMTTEPERRRDPNAPAPSLEVYLEPPKVQAGDPTELVWHSSFADKVVIDHQIGAVTIEGRIRIFPEQTSTYAVTASGPGGSLMKAATVTVTAPDERTDELDLDDASLERLFNTFVNPVFFDFDSAELSREAEFTLEGNIRWLSEPAHRSLRFAIQGHCDQRGTEEYNLALGDKRAEVVRLYLGQHGIDANRMTAVSLGEERPFAAGGDEETHALNRRAHFVLLQDEN